MSKPEKTLLCKGSYQICVRKLSQAAVKNGTSWLIIKKKEHRIRYKCAMKECNCRAELMSCLKSGEIIWKAFQYGEHDEHEKFFHPKPLKEHLLLTVAKSSFESQKLIHEEIGTFVPEYIIRRIKREKLSDNSWELLWKKLPSFVESLQKNQIHADLLVGEDNVIKSIFVAMPNAPKFCSSSAFLGMVFIDGTFCTNKMKTTIIGAVTVTADRIIIPLAVALVVGNETIENYTYFLTNQLEYLSDSENLTFIVDQHPSIQSSLSAVYPNSRYIPCAWHVAKHLHCPSIVLFELLKTDHPSLFNTRWKEFEKDYPESSKKVSNIISVMSYTGQNKTKLGYFTDSPIESFNKAILELRDKEPLLILDGILRWSIGQCSKQLSKLDENLYCKTTYKKIQYRREESKLLPVKNQKDGTFIVIEIYQNATEIDYLFRENDDKLFCDCNGYDRDGIPCRHEYAVAERYGIETKLRPIALFNHSNIIRNSLENISKIPNLGQLEERNIPLPKVVKHPGRPKKVKRIKSSKEDPKKKRKCSYCKKLAYHNKRTCPERLGKITQKEDSNIVPSKEEAKDKKSNKVYLKRKQFIDICDMREEKLDQKQQKKRTIPRNK